MVIDLGWVLIASVAVALGLFGVMVYRWTEQQHQRQIEEEYAAWRRGLEEMNGWPCRHCGCGPVDEHERVHIEVRQCVKALGRWRQGWAEVPTPSDWARLPRGWREALQ